MKPASVFAAHEEAPVERSSFARALPLSALQMLAARHIIALYSDVFGKNILLMSNKIHKMYLISHDYLITIEP